MATSRHDSAYLADPSLSSGDENQHEIIGDSPAMSRLRMQVQRLGPHFRTVLVRGDAGTGKALTARILHRLSQGAGGPFVVFHIEANRPDSPASEDKNTSIATHLDRMVKSALGGTLFFDRMSEMPMEMQSHLLRVLRRQEGSSLAKMDLRIIASTREDLKALAFTGRFLQELSQRLSMVEITLPPLRDRQEDIPALAKYLLSRSNRAFGTHVEDISEDMIGQLQARSWPGNVRELEETLHYAVQRCQGPVLAIGDLQPPHEENAAKSETIDSAGITRLQDIVEQHVLRVLKHCAGNKLRTAEMLGISRSTLYRMLETRSFAEDAAARGRAGKTQSFAG